MAFERQQRRKENAEVSLRIFIREALDDLIRCSTMYLASMYKFV